MSAPWLQEVLAHSGLQPGDQATPQGARVVEQILEAWPGSPASPKAWGQVLARACNAGGPTLPPARWQELALARACILGEPAGVAAVDAALLEVAAQHKRSSRHGADAVDEATQRVRQKLMLDGPNGPARLVQFEGRGPLQGFLRTALVRELSTLVRETRREVALEDHEPDSPQPLGEMALLKHTYGPMASQAFKDAFAALPQDQQRLLQQVYAHGMTVDDLAKVHQVHRATCARWVARARGDLGEATRRLLQERLGMPRRDADSMLDALQSALSVSLGWASAGPRSTPRG